MDFRAFFRRASLSSVLLFLAGAAGYLLRIFYARVLPKEDVGLFYALFDLFMLLGLLRNLGWPQGLVKTIPEFLARGQKALVARVLKDTARLQALWSLSLCFLLFFLGKSLLKHYLPQEGVAEKALLPFRFFLLAFFLKAELDLFREALLGFQRYVEYQFVNFLTITLALLLSVFFWAFFTFENVFLPVSAYTASYFFTVLVTLFLLSRALPRWWTYTGFLADRRFWVNFTRQSLLLLVGSTGLAIVGFLDGLCLARLAELEKVAYYRNAAYPAATILLYPARAFIAAAFPYVAKLRLENRLENLKSTIGRVYLTVLVFTSPLALVFVWAAPKIILTLFGQAYAPAISAFQILSFGMIFFNTAFLGFSVLNGLGRLGLAAASVYLVLGLDLLGNVFLIPLYGLKGAAWSTVGALFLASLFQGYVLYRS